MTRSVGFHDLNAKNDLAGKVTKDVATGQTLIKASRLEDNALLQKLKSQRGCMSFTATMQKLEDC